MLRNFCFILLFSIVSCGQDEFPDYKDDNFVFYEEGEGIYSGSVILLNRYPRRRVRIESLFMIKGDQFYTKIFIQGALPETRIVQFLHSGSRCPTLSDDLNHDGMIDMTEAILASGEILIPLDKYIQNQAKGREWFPTTSKKGSYYYSKAASVSKMLQDLYAKDKAPNDGIMKLKKGEPLRLEERTLILYGTKKDPLLPIACISLEPK